MEKVALVDRMDKLRDLENKYDRIYYGNEFCDQLLPSTSELDSVLRFCQKRSLKTSVVMPYFNQENSEQVNCVLKYLWENHPGIEVVINDYGALYLLYQRYQSLRIILGRIFSRQKRGTMVKCSEELGLGQEDTKNPADDSYFEESILQNRYALEYLKSIGVERLGIDNIFNIPNINTDILVDLYFPYIFITTSNYCLFYSYGNQINERVRPHNCKRFCQKTNVREMDLNGKIMYLKGNTQFGYNGHIPEDKKINRLVEVII